MSLTYNPFIFRSGQQAQTIEDLSQLCAKFPKDTIYHLKEGHFETWLTYIGSNDLAQIAQQSRMSSKENKEWLKKFLDSVRSTSKRCDEANHQWNGCLCSLCGETRDQNHPSIGWEKFDDDCCICLLCGKPKKHDMKLWFSSSSVYDETDIMKCTRCNLKNEHYQFYT